GIGRRIEEELRAGESLLAAGEIAGAEAAFRRAAAIDPEDPAARAYLQEAEATLVLARELARRAGEPEDAIRLDPRPSEAQAAAGEEGRGGQGLLGALAVLGEDARLPERKLLAALHPVEIADASAFGPTLARRLAGGEVEVRAAYAPDGTPLARFYFPAGG